MRNYVLRRLAHAIPVLFGVATVVFIALRLIPGDPAVAMVGDKASQAEVERIRQDLGLNEPLWTQFAIWIGNVLQGNFGESFFFKKTVAELIAQRIEPTLALATCTLIFAVVVSVPLDMGEEWIAESRERLAAARAALGVDAEDHRDARS